MARATLWVTAAIGGVLAGSLVTAGPVDAVRAAPRAITVTPAPPDVLSAPRLIVTRRAGTPVPGFIFAGPKVDQPSGHGRVRSGPMIADGRGRPVYFVNTGAAVHATDVRVQTYHGRRVLTYWLGRSGLTPGYGEGDDYIVGQNYKVLRVVHGHGGAKADLHEFLLTADNKALILCYRLAHVDTSSIGGPADQEVLDGVVQEIDLRTNKLVFEWHSLKHVNIADSYVPLPGDATVPWDYFHINAVKVDTDGNFLISARHTWAVYKVSRTTKRTMWTLGGKHSSFAIGRGAAFSWQHDPEPLGHNTYRVFDNAWNQLDTTRPTHAASRVLTIRLDLTRRTATRMRRVAYPAATLSAGSQGNSQQLPSGHLFVDWGAADRLTEFDVKRDLIFDAYFADGYNSYRAYKSPWAGVPAWSPRVVLSSPGGRRQIDAVWNGAGTVVRWRILGGATPDSLHIIGRVLWRGFDTAFRLTRYPAYVRLAAIDARGRTIRRTGLLHIG